MMIVHLEAAFKATIPSMVLHLTCSRLVQRLFPLSEHPPDEEIPIPAAEILPAATEWLSLHFSLTGSNLTLCDKTTAMKARRRIAIFIFRLWKRFMI
jgi:hypothetical protein